jgi:hypothetical protein
MRRNAIFQLALVGLAGVLIQNSRAGSAVAWGPGHLGTAYGAPVEVAKARAIENCRRKGVANPKLIGATDVVGYGAIAVALQPGGHGSLIGVSLGRRSATEADALAIAQCVKAGGTHAKVRWGFRG